uniref:Tyrosine-protein phosphatase domain-containing protein n=1 Tax=Ascaris lumbricoides TaxID=6252 RepID=A0A0M3IN97_ASCLU
LERNKSLIGLIGSDGFGQIYFAIDKHSKGQLGVATTTESKIRRGKTSMRMILEREVSFIIDSKKVLALSFVWFTVQITYHSNKKQKKKASGVAPMKRDATNEEVTISPDEPKTMNITDVIPKTKTKKKKTLGRPMNDNIRSVIDAFVEHIKTIGIQGLRGEFVEIRNMKPKASECTKFLQNREKNRYRDVACLDSTRVVLRVNVPPECDYIHANWMQMEGCQRRYIATQGPLETTIGDFWRMIYQESIKTIVMLCKLVENGKVKCSQYWPDLPGTHKSFSILTIENKGVLIFIMTPIQ